MGGDEEAVGAEFFLGGGFVGCQGGPFFGRHLFGGLRGLHDLRSILVFHGAGKALDSIQIFNRFDRPAGHVQENFIPDECSGWNVFGLGGAVAPDREFAEDGLIERRQRAAPRNFVHWVWGSKTCKVGSASEADSSADPGGPAWVEALADLVPGRGEVSHVIGGVAKLMIGERSAIPMGECQPFSSLAPTNAMTSLERERG